MDNSLGDTWNTALKGLMRWSGSFDVNYDTAQATLFNAATTATAAQPIYLYPTRADTAKYYYGTCWPKLSLKGDLSSTIGGSVAFVGDGNLYAV